MRQLARRCLAGAWIGEGVLALHMRALPRAGHPRLRGMTCRAHTRTHARATQPPKRCTLYNQSDKDTQRGLYQQVVPKGTEYVSLMAADILPDSLPSSKHCLRTGLMNGSAGFARFARL